MHAFNFQTGDTAGMYTASAVVIIGIFSGKGRPVGVTGDQNEIFSACIILQTLFGFMFAGIVLCGTCRVKNAVMLQRLLEIPHKKTGEAP